MNAPREPKSVAVVRRATMSDLALLAEIYSEAFAADPLLAWVNPKSPRFAGALFASLAKKCCLKHNEVHVTADGSGVAMWLPPSNSSATLPLWTQFALGCRLWADCGSGGLRRIFSLQNCLQKNHISQPHWYLLAVGVRPARAGQGVGSALLRESLPKCDRDKLPACLETSNPKNLPLYEHFGFAVTTEARLPLGGPPLWFMTRKPIASL